MKVKPVEIKGQLHIQFEYQYERVLNHENVTPDVLRAHLQQLLERFRQIHAEFSDEKIQIHRSLCKLIVEAPRCPELQTLASSLQLVFDFFHSDRET